MKQTIWAFVTFCSLTMLFSCDNGETYADRKEREKNAINRFIKEHEIKVISYDQFLAQDSTTNVDENEYVLFNEDGIYMQIEARGEGKSMIEMAKE